MTENAVKINEHIIKKGLAHSDTLNTEGGKPLL